MTDTTGEKRVHERLECRVEITFTDGMRVFTEMVLDVSLGGILIQTMTPLETGQEVTMNIMTSPPTKVQGIVRWVRKQGFRYHLGVEFRNVTPDQEKGIRSLIQSIYWGQGG